MNKKILKVLGSIFTALGVLITFISIIDIPEKLKKWKILIKSVDIQFEMPVLNQVNLSWIFVVIGIFMFISATDKGEEILRTVFKWRRISPLKIEFKGIFSRINHDDIDSYQTYWCEIYNPSDETVKNVSVSLIYNQEHPLKYQRHGGKPSIEFSPEQRERVDLISCGKINSVPKQQIVIEGDGEKIWVDIDLGHLFKVKVTAKGYPALIKDFGFSIKGDKQPPDFKVYPG